MGRELDLISLCDGGFLTEGVWCVCDSEGLPWEWSPQMGFSNPLMNSITEMGP